MTEKTEPKLSMELDRALVDVEVLAGLVRTALIFDPTADSSVQAWATLAVVNRTRADAVIEELAGMLGSDVVARTAARINEVINGSVTTVGPWSGVRRTRKELRRDENGDLAEVLEIEEPVTRT